MNGNVTTVLMSPVTLLSENVQINLLNTLHLMHTLYITIPAHFLKTLFSDFISDIFLLNVIFLTHTLFYWMLQCMKNWAFLNNTKALRLTLGVSLSDSLQVQYASSHFHWPPIFVMEYNMRIPSTVVKYVHIRESQQLHGPYLIAVLPQPYVSDIDDRQQKWSDETKPWLLRTIGSMT